MMKIIVHRDLLWKDSTDNPDNILCCLKGDQIAQANGGVYVESFIRKYPDGTILVLDEDLQIVEERKVPKYKMKIEGEFPLQADENLKAILHGLGLAHRFFDDTKGAIEENKEALIMCLGFNITVIKGDL